MLATLVAIALVVQDQAPLRAAAQDSAPRQATLWQGEWLEVRGERQGFIQVYDHRRERPGYAGALRRTGLPGGPARPAGHLPQEQ